jgi:hypothetical protein
MDAIKQMGKIRFHRLLRIILLQRVYFSTIGGAGK